MKVYFKGIRNDAKTVLITLIRRNRAGGLKENSEVNHSG